ncbi:pyruvate kinase [Listeria grandensis FSL F6-0971]|uniref:Pyruvate kinase n=1 Tax=Listeria grandensis FSL F6-0971 TaxID=1265819 RepID=W7BIK3_9LIST|nr:pyruvate kinase [Listeria grandensis FSL F6-0971]
MKKTKIVCTIGPASETVETLVQLIESGMNVCRLNFSHGDYEEHGARIKNIREAVKITGTEVAILLDTKGPEIRTNDMENGKLEFAKGDTVRVAMEEVLGTKEKFSVTYTELFDDVEIGSTILLDDGLIGLEVIEKDAANRELITNVQNPGVLKNKKRRERAKRIDQPTWYHRKRCERYPFRSRARNRLYRGIIRASRNRRS